MTNNRSLPVRPLLTGLVLLASTCSLSAQRAEFNIIKGDNVVGRIVAMKNEAAQGTDYFMTSYAEVDVVLKQVVRTSMSAGYRNGLLQSCHSTVNVNGSVRDSSRLALRDGKQLCYVHPGPAVQKDVSVAWTTARMYFEEPTDAPAIFVESVLALCPLQRTAEGRYTLTFPNKQRNHYIYKNGVLQEIQVDRPFFDLVFRRV
ncbi:MAG TPA: DUF6134 family protein [Flavobacteriales bacterium]|nr:DUF6134 family protein [Flavobacteriales bacterium]